MYVYSLGQWLLFFFLYCFLGWVWESCYVSAKRRQWVNRGFLHGPMLPIYGTGAVIILLATIPVRDSLWLVFLLGMLAVAVKLREEKRTDGPTRRIRKRKVAH